MDSDQLERMKEMASRGLSSRQIAAEDGMPTHTTVQKWLSKVSTGVSSDMERVSTPEGVSTLDPVLETSLSRSLLGMRLSPREVLDAKEAGQLPANARLDPWGRVEVSDEEPLWPAYSAGGFLQGLKARYGTMKAEAPRPARR